MAEKQQYEMEFVIKTSPNILYNRLSTPSGLSEWFADNVNIKDDVLTFIWDGSEEEARILKKKKGEFVRYQWLNDEEEGNDVFFEMAIKISSMTNGVALIITDFAEEDEIEENKELWEAQINNLMHILGS